MRLLLAGLLALVLLTRPAPAASLYDDVPVGHWAYDTLQCLVCSGMLEGYPQDFFSGERTLVRFEFAQAIARLIADFDSGKLAACNAELLDCLYAEFADESFGVWSSATGYTVQPRQFYASPPLTATDAQRHPALNLWDGIVANPQAQPRQPQAVDVPVWACPFTATRIAEATASAPGMEYTLALYLDSDNSAIWQLRAVNTGAEPVELNFDTNERCDFRVLDDGNLRWNYNNNRFFYQSPVYFVVEPGAEHALEFRSQPWDGTDNAQQPWLDFRVPGSLAGKRFEAVLLLSGQPVRLGFATDLK
jgi:hypothetical protein